MEKREEMKSGEYFDHDSPVCQAFEACPTPSDVIVKKDSSLTERMRRGEE